MTPAIYEDKIYKLEREIELRKSQLSEYMQYKDEVEQFKEQLKEQLEYATSTIKILEGTIESVKEDRADVLARNQVLKKELEKLESGEDQDRRIRDLEHDLDDVKEKLREQEDFDDLIWTRVYEIISNDVLGSDQISWGWTSRRHPAIPKSWEEMLDMLRKYVWSNDAKK